VAALTESTVPRIGRATAWSPQAAALDQVEDIVVGRVGGLGDLLGHHLLLAGQVGFIERRAQQQVGDDIHAQVEAALQGADLEAGALIAGGGVDRAALALDDLDDVARAARCRPP
jgi:hypothetical protein